MPKPNSERRLIGHEHLHLFGAVTHIYAVAENNLKFIMAGLLNVDLNTIMILTEPYGSHQLRNVLSSLNKNVATILETLGPQNHKRLIDLIGQLKSFGPLRNNIAHNLWIVGKRPGSIKPIRLDIQSGKAKYIGLDEEEKDYTLGDLRKEAQSLEQLRADIFVFISDTGLQEVIEEKIRVTRLVIESSGGNSTMKP